MNYSKEFNGKKIAYKFVLKLKKKLSCWVNYIITRARKKIGIPNFGVVPHFEPVISINNLQAYQIKRMGKEQKDKNFIRIG